MIEELVLAGYDVIKGIIAIVEAAADGKVSPDAARAQIDALAKTLTANDAAADAALRAKFPDDEDRRS